MHRDCLDAQPAQLQPVLIGCLVTADHIQIESATPKEPVVLVHELSILLDVNLDALCERRVGTTVEQEHRTAAGHLPSSRPHNNTCTCGSTVTSRHSGRSKT